MFKTQPVRYSCRRRLIKARKKRSFPLILSSKESLVILVVLFARNHARVTGTFAPTAEPTNDSTSSSTTGYIPSALAPTSLGTDEKPSKLIPALTASPTEGSSIRLSDHPSSVPSSHESKATTGVPSTGKTFLPTTEPTVKFSEAPTAESTNQPSLEPSIPLSTDSPTAIPTIETRTESPTINPTVSSSTESPTTCPTTEVTRRDIGQTLSPTDEPTVPASTSPTIKTDKRFDTEEPSNIIQFPTETPSSNGGAEPTTEVLFEPTIAPTFRYTVEPSDTPGSPQTPEPTSSSDSVPTFSPFVEPSSTPDSELTLEPTPEPSLGRDETSEPRTPEPTRAPTYKKTFMPTSDPASDMTPIPTVADTSNRQDTPGPAGSVPVTTDSPSFQEIEETDFPTFSPAPSGESTPTPTTRSSSNLPNPPPTSGPVDQPASNPSKIPTTEEPSASVGRETARPTEKPTGSPTDISAPSPTNEATGEPTLFPTTETPTDLISPTTGPTQVTTDFPTPPLPWPTPQPISRQTKTPSSDPTTIPSDVPSSTPTRTSRSPSSCPSSLPSQVPSVSSYPSTETQRPTFSTAPSFWPSIAPSDFPSLLLSAPPTSPPSAYPTQLPSDRPSQSPSLPLQSSGERVAMTLKYSAVLEGLSIITWEKQTAEHIRLSIENAKLDTPLDDLQVWTNIVRQSVIIEPDDTSTARLVSNEPTVRRRYLQAQTSLRVAFDTALEFRSTNNKYDIQELIAGAFDTEEDQANYINRLKRTNNAAFSDLNKIESISIGGVVIPPVEEEPQEKDGGRDMTIFIIIGAAAGGGALILLILFFVSRKYMGKNRSSAGNKTETVSDLNTNPDGNRVQTEIVVEHTPDEVSTLGDPMYTPNGMLINTMERDEHTASVGDDYDYKYLKHHNFGSGVDPSDRLMKEDTSTRLESEDRSRLDDIRSRMNSEDTLGRDTSSKTGVTSQSKLGFSQMGQSIFSDDASFEEQYNEPEQEVPFEITVPAGKLGMVIDTPNGGFPIVHAIKDTSILADRVRVGDRLISVDGQDCTAMTAVQVSKLISLKSDQNSRILVFVRSRASAT